MSKTVLVYSTWCGSCGANEGNYSPTTVPCACGLQEPHGRLAPDKLEGLLIGPTARPDVARCQSQAEANAVLVELVSQVARSRVADALLNGFTVPGDPDPEADPPKVLHWDVDEAGNLVGLRMISGRVH